MDSIVAQHSCLQALLIYHNLKDCFIFLENELFFLNKFVYGEKFVIILKGNKEGLEILYYDTGEKMREIKWKDDKKEGVEIVYRSGVKWIERNWRDDKLEGLDIEYYESGEREYEKQWKNGILIREDHY